MLAGVALALGSANAGAQGSIAGTVFDSLRTRAPLAGATVVLVERSRYATADARGRFRFDSVPDGHYTIGFMHPVLDSLDLRRRSSPSRSRAAARRWSHWPLPARRWPTRTSVRACMIPAPA